MLASAAADRFHNTFSFSARSNAPKHKQQVGAGRGSDFLGSKGTAETISSN